MLVNNKGQSILEYVIVLTAIIAAIIIFATGVLKPKLGDSLEHVAGEMQTQAERIHWGD